MANEVIKAAGEYIKTSIMPRKVDYLKAMNIDPQIFQQSLLSAVMREKKLAECDRMSLYAACGAAIEYGVIPDGRNGVIVPIERYDPNAKRKKLVAEFWVMLAGMLQAVRKDLPNTAFNYNPVFKIPDGEGDHWEDHRGTEPRLVHRPNPNVPQIEANLFAVYATAHHPENPIPDFEVMYRPEIDSMRKNNKGPWTTSFVRMAMARPMKRLLRRMPVSDRTKKMIETGPDAESAQEVEEAPVVNNPAPQRARQNEQGPKPAPLPAPEEQPDMHVQMDAEYDPAYDLG